MSNLRLTSPIPTDTRRALKLHNWQIDNIALLLNKYLDFFMIEKCKQNTEDCFIKEKMELSNSNLKGNIRIKGRKYIEINYKIKKILKNTVIKNISFYPLIKKEDYNDLFNKIFERNILNPKRNKELKGLDEKFVKNLLNDLKVYRNTLIENIQKGKIKELLNKAIERQEKIADKKIELTTQSRLIVGLGSDSVLETSIKLHHIYGVPYIPASAIKGVLRAYRIWKLAEWNEEKFKEIEKRIDENKPNGDKEKKIIKIFGNQQQKGKLIVLDAYPTNFEGFDIDIMNPHFPEYYDEDKPPADWQNPTPITFLAIPKGTEFKFFFKNTSVYDQNLENDLKEAFENIGIGGKTSLGYGILV
jgi:CRISPR-associated protein Cmr6